MSKNSKNIDISDEEQLTAHNANVVASFMNHCKDNGVDIPDNLFESYFNA